MVTEIKESTDFEKFESLKWNRLPNELRVKRLEDSIRRYGFVLPIMVTPDFKILDGQHRWTAARNIKHKLLYMIIDVPKTSIPSLVIDLNTTSHSWILLDYVKAYSEIGVESYVWLTSAIQTAKSLQIMEIMRLMGISSGKAFKDGTLVISDNQKARFKERLSQLKNLMGLEEKFLQMMGLSTALIRAITAKNFEYVRMHEVLKKEPGSIVRARHVSDYCFMLQEMYNANLPNRKRITLALH
jgi:hypothetical protein